MFVREDALRMVNTKRLSMRMSTVSSGSRRTISLNSLPGTTPRPGSLMSAGIRVTMVMRSSEQVSVSSSMSVSISTPSRIWLVVRLASAFVAI